MRIMKSAALLGALLALPGLAFGGWATLGLTLADGTSAIALPPVGGTIELRILVNYADVPAGIANVDGYLQASADDVFTVTHRAWGGPFDPARADFAAAESLDGPLTPFSKPLGVVCLGGGSGPADVKGKRNYVAPDNGTLPWTIETITLSVVGIPGVYSLGFSANSYVGSSDFDAKVGVLPTTLGSPITVTVQSGPIPFEIVSAVSRKIHGTAGVYDRAADTIEGRLGGPTRIVTTFNQPIRRINNSNADIALSSGTLGAVSIGMAPNDNVLTVDVSDVTNMSVFTIGYPGIAANDGNSTTPALNCWKCLVGDVDGVSPVTTFDLMLVRGALGRDASASDFGMDLNASGRINNTDIVLCRGRLGQAVDTPCAP